MPKVSVLMSVFSEPLEWLHDSIDSILSQTFTDFEFIIINDNPERTELSEFLKNEGNKDARIIIKKNDHNIGLTRSLNLGLKMCSGEYIARMDADDISMPTRFAKQVAFMDSHPEVIVCGTNIEYFGHVSPLTFSDWIYETDSEIKAQMLSNSGFAHPTVFIRRNVLNCNTIIYDEEYRHGQDYRLWEMLYDFGKFHNLMEKLLKYRVSETQISKRSINEQCSLSQQIQRRMRIKWLCNHNIHYDTTLSPDDIIKISKYLNSNSLHQKSALILLRTYYLSRRNKRYKYFVESIRIGVFRHLSSKDKLRYISWLMGIKPAVPW